MKRNILRLLTLLIFLYLSLTTKSIAQIEFEKGYIIDISNQKIECLIKNVDWFNNPNMIEYKLSDTESIQTADVQSIKEFGIYGESKFISALVKIDRSGSEISKLSSQRNPIWSDEKLFLKVLVEGKASLLYCKYGNLERFFYQSQDVIEQLVFKEYWANDANERKVNQNNMYKQQVWLYTKDCGNVTEKSMQQLSYNKHDLINHFKKYNQCVGIPPVSYTTEKKRNQFDLKIFGGLNLTTVSVEDYYNLTPSEKRDVTFDTKSGISLGIEPEFILPFNKGKWSIFLAPSYQYYSGENEFASIQYGLLEIPLGVRYFAFLNTNSRLFADIAYAKNVAQKSEIDLGYPTPLKITPGNSFEAGVGFEFRQFSTEIKYVRCGNLLTDYKYWKIPYSRVSFIVGIRLFRKAEAQK